MYTMPDRSHLPTGVIYIYLILDVQHLGGLKNGQYDGYNLAIYHLSWKLATTTTPRKKKNLPSLKLTVRPWNAGVGRWVSLWILA